MLSKISTIDNNEEYAWNNVYELEEFQSFNRLKIGCASLEVAAILNFCKNMNGPFGVLHVLLVSRTGERPGRYESTPFTYEELELFLWENQEYIEQDGRHHIWVSSLSNEGQFIYDQHNFIYAYGDTEGYMKILQEKGFTQDSIEITCPHTHNYHFEFDDHERSLTQQPKWKHHPLQDGDDY